MTASKVSLFGDDLALLAILATVDPREQKCLDRQVHHFDHDVCQKDASISSYEATL